MKVLVTGSSKGIGRSIVETFLENGHKVIGFDIHPARYIHQNFTQYIIDITSDNLPDIKDIDILVNNAGIQTQTLKDIDVNLKGTINITEKYGIQSNIKSILLWLVLVHLQELNFLNM